MKLQIKKFLKYTTVPGFTPRVRELFFSGFSNVAFFMAQILRTVGLLPEGHPYLSAGNSGKFGIRHVLVEAGNNLVFKKENIDQILIYFMMIFGLVLICAQMSMLLLSGFVDVAHAGPLLYGSSSPLDFFKYFRTPDATHELAFVLLDRVFGIPGAGGDGTSFFADKDGGYTCVVQGIRCFDLGQNTVWAGASTQDGIDRYVATNYDRTNFEDINFPWPYHNALRGMLQLYSVGLLVIGVFIFLYFVFALAAETAQTGTPFGRRFNHIWAPLRIVVAMGLLVPITYGLNPAQWILMFAAKWGSSFATNGWIIYNTTMTSSGSLLGDPENLVATPQDPPINTLMEFGTVLATCKTAYERVYYERTDRKAVKIDAYLVNPQKTGMQAKKLVGTSFQQALEYFDMNTMHIRFGELRGEEHQEWDGLVAPFCGELTLSVPFTPDNAYAAANDTAEPGSFELELQYYELIQYIWENVRSGGGNAAGFSAPTSFHDIGEKMTDRIVPISGNSSSTLPSSDDLAGLRSAFEKFVHRKIEDAVTLQAKSNEWKEQLTELGWGGAAVWYNKIAQLNGGLVSAVYSMPTVQKYPWIMEQIRIDKSGAVSNVSGNERHQNYTGNEDKPLDTKDQNNVDIAKALYETQRLWTDQYSSKAQEGNIFKDAINTIFGTKGLFDIVSNDSQNISPLAQLATIGRTIVDSAIRNLGYSAAAGLGGGIINLFQQHQVGAFAGSASSFLFQVAMIGLSVGFVLFYIIPFLPFIYFFFAVGGWIKAIFEAMVGVPLWALAHIRIDGNGLPGDAAMGGYYLILEIFLRPIMTIFGFIASIMIFTAQVQILNEIWPLVTTSVAGFDTTTATDVKDQTNGISFMRHEVDEFFYTIMYAIICYMMAMGSFKLIDQVPNHILRWMGASVSTFGDQQEEPAQNLVRNSFISANMVAGPMKQAAGNLKQAGQQSTAAVQDLFSRSTK